MLLKFASIHSNIFKCAFHFNLPRLQNSPSLFYKKSALQRSTPRFDFSKFCLLAYPFL